MKFNLTDSLTAIAVFTLIYLAIKDVHPDLAGFGEGFAGIFGGKSFHNGVQGWSNSLIKPDKDGTV